MSTRNTKKIIGFILTALIIATVLIGCQPQPPTTTSEQNSTIDNRVRTIQDRGTLRVGVIVQAPFSLKNTDTGEWFGISVDFLEFVAEQKGDCAIIKVYSFKAFGKVKAGF